MEFALGRYKRKKLHERIQSLNAALLRRLQDISFFDNFSFFFFLFLRANAASMGSMMRGQKKIYIYVCVKRMDEEIKVST